MLKTAGHTETLVLPDPDELPGRQVVIWDGHCNFCRSQVMRLYRLDWTRQLSFLSLHDERVEARYSGLSYEQLMEQMWVIGLDGSRWGGADAIRYLSRKMPALWPLWPILHMPLCMPLWRSMYRSIAKRRYRLAGKNCDSGSCSLHAK